MEVTSTNNAEPNQSATINKREQGKLADENRREGTNKKSERSAETDAMLAQIFADEERCSKTYAMDLNKWTPDPDLAVTYDMMPKGYMEESITAYSFKDAFSLPDQLLTKKIENAARKCGDSFFDDDDARLKAMAKTLGPLMEQVPKPLPPEYEYMLVRIPGYIRVNFKKKSCLDAAEMKNLVDLQMSGTIEPILSDEAKKEQEEFQSVLNVRWPSLYSKRPHEIPNSVKLVIDELQKSRVKASLKNYDHFYKLIGTIPLKHIQESGVDFKLGSNLHQPSRKPTIKVPNTLCMDDTFIKLPIVLEEIRKFVKITPSAEKVPVRDDKYACQMAHDMSADVVITGTALKTLFSTDGDTFSGEWMLPISVKHSANPITHSAVKTIFVDKPLPQPKLTSEAKKKWFVKMATEQFVMKKARNQQRRSENKATGQQPLNYCYKIWALKKDVSKENGGQLKNEPIRVLVRNRPVALDIAPLAKQKEYVVHTTIEYVAEYGASRVSRPENLKLWLKLALNPKSSLVRLRYTHEMHLLLTEFLDAKRIAKEATYGTIDPPKNNFANVYGIFEALLNYPPGNYILSYNSVSGEFANIYVSSPSCDDSDLNLESCYDAPEQDDAKYVVNCPEIDTGVLTPYHIYSGVYPAMFPPIKPPQKKKLYRDYLPWGKPNATKRNWNDG